MADKTLYTLTLGGNDVTLKLKNGALRRFKELSGKDPLDVLTGADTIGNIDFAEWVVKAGMLANDPKADVSKVTEWIDDAGPTEVKNIIQAFAAAYTPDTPAAVEGSENTQQQASELTGAV